MAARKTRTKQETRKGKVASGERAPSARLSPEHRRSVNDGRSSADRALALRSRSPGAVTVQSASRTPRSGGTQLRHLEVGGGWRDQPRVVTRKDGKGRMQRQHERKFSGKVATDFRMGGVVPRRARPEQIRRRDEMANEVLYIYMNSRRTSFHNRRHLLVHVC